MSTSQIKNLPKLISWVGGKHFMVGKLLPLIPKHDTYIEPLIKIVINKFNIYTIDMYYPSKKVTVEELLVTNYKL